MKKIFSLLISIFLVGVSAYSQELIPDKNEKGKWGYVDSDGTVIIKHNYNEVFAFVDGRAKVRKGNKWGYINPSGKEVIKIQYSEMRTWSGNYCKVAKGGKSENGLLTSGGKWGYINRNGDEILKCEYDEIGAFKDGVAYIKKGDKYGYIDDNYQIFIPCKYNAVGSFNDKGYCWVNEGCKSKKDNPKQIEGGKFGVYNRNGELIIKPNYKMIGTFTHLSLGANPYYAEIIDSEIYDLKVKASVKEGWKQRQAKNEAGLYGQGSFYYFTALTDQITPEDNRIMQECNTFELLTYDFIEPEKFSSFDMPINNYFAVSNNVDKKNRIYELYAHTYYKDKIGIIDGYGEVILEPGKYEIAYFPTEDFIPVAKEKKKKLQVNYYNIKTKKLLYKKWIDAVAISPFKDGVAVIMDEGRQYLINTGGEKISAEYNRILPPQNETYIVENNGYGLIDATGKEIISTSFNLILPVSEDLMCVQQEKDGSFGYMNCNGEYVITPKYSDARSFKNGAALVKTADGWGEINKTDEITIKCNWEDIIARSSTSPMCSWVKKDGLWYGLDISTNELITKGYISAYNFNEDNIAYVVDNNALFGVINTSDELIIPCQLSTLNIAITCYNQMKENGKTSMEEIDVYRFNLMLNEDRNNFRITEKITPNLWDF